MKNYNTGFAIRYEKDGIIDFVKDNGRVCIYTLSQTIKVRKELKAKGYEVMAMPYCE